MPRRKRLFSDEAYERMAETIRKLLATDQCTRMTFNRLKAFMAEVFREDNPHFDAGAWEERCEP
jgi:hypothetical protein